MADCQVIFFCQDKDLVGCTTPSERRIQWGFVVSHKCDTLVGTNKHLCLFLDYPHHKLMVAKSNNSEG